MGEPSMPAQASSADSRSGRAAHIRAKDAAAPGACSYGVWIVSSSAIVGSAPTQERGVSCGGARA
jgi:hypothetical protein